ncbi:MAG: aminoglycoside phosphotransferase family protein [Chloroflexi bacterium]|nr:aminoglycoside phosphotransferase family protein [Chloroflexota bacterium]
MEPSHNLGVRARISANVLRDYMIRPIAREPADVPWGPRGLSEEWLTAALCDKVPGARVESLQVGGGHDGSNVRRALRVAYNDIGERAGLPTALYTKSTPTLLTRLASGVGAASEARFLTRFGSQVPIELPILYFSTSDRASGRKFHIFEDLVATKAAAFCGISTNISRDRADQIVDTLAALHGHFYGSALPTDQRFVTYDAWFQGGARLGIKESHDRAMVEAEDVIPPDVFARKDDIWPTAVRMLELHHREPLTLLHSDVHLGNWYVTGAGRMGLADWGCVALGHWARDFAYAISTTLQVEDRRLWEKDLLMRYLDAMRESCDLKVSFEVAWNQYRSQLFAALLMWTPTLCHPPTMPDMQPAYISRELIRRMAIAISDLDTFNCEVCFHDQTPGVVH